MRGASRIPSRGIFHDEEGFSTVGMVLALLLTLALVFTAAQVYQINSASADIQNVADAAALASENVVAEFYVLSQVSDAIILSCSLTGLGVMGMGVVLLCVPPTAALGETFIDAGTKVLKARDSFAQKAAAGLNRLQKTLPFLCAASAAQLASASGSSGQTGGAAGGSYRGFSLILPFEGEEIAIDPLQGAQDLIDKVEEEKDEVKEASKAAEEAAEQANVFKQIGYEHDCGLAPNYCMQERAERLAGLSPEENPRYHGVDTWSFDVAMKRAKTYYPRRFAIESPTNSSAKEQASSALRRNFFRYASEEIATGYVYDDGEVFDAYFPRFPKSLGEMRGTGLYTEEVYPLSTGDDSGVVTYRLHAWEGCPGLAQGYRGDMVSLERWERIYEQFNAGTCEHCEFTPAKFGQIVSASSSIDNGFEYHYIKVADAADAYKRARDDFKPQADKAKELARGLLDTIKEVAQGLSSARIEAKPPGRFGSVAFVISSGVTGPSERVLTSFVKSDARLGTRVAISASGLVRGSEEEGETIISSLLDGFSGRFDSGIISGADKVLDFWSWTLQAYRRGNEGVERALEEGLDSLPLMSASGIGSWAAKLFSDSMRTLGLQPAELRVPKPVLVNSAHVLAADPSKFGKNLLDTKRFYTRYAGEIGQDPFSSLLHATDISIGGVDFSGGRIQIASIELFGEDGPSIPLSFALPPAVQEVGGDFFQGVKDTLEGLSTSLGGGRRWR